MTRVSNKRNKEKCKIYKSENRRAINKKRKAEKIAKRLAKAKARREKRENK